MSKDFDVGIVGDWFVTYAGSEKVVAELLKIYQDASLYATNHYLIIRK